MLKVLMILSGGFEALFGLSALLATHMLIEALGTGADASSIFFARVLGAATLGLGIAALLARNELDSAAGLAAAYGLALYNVVAAALILWSAAAGTLSGAALWGAGLFHAAMGALFVYALLTHRVSPRLRGNAAVASRASTDSSSRSASTACR
jgi:hypothetical protein